MAPKVSRIPFSNHFVRRWFGVVFFFCLACVNVWGQRVVLQMNNDWAFLRGDVADGAAPNLNDSRWIAATIPHIMQLEKKHCGGNIIYDGVGWYRRYFMLPQTYRNKRVVVEFEGVMKNCDVFLNGHHVGSHDGGYMGFTIDLTPYIRWDVQNVIAVRVDGADDPLTPPGKSQGNMDFYYYSGIYRDVRMVLTEKVFITDPLQENVVAGGGQFVTFPHVNREQATVCVATHVRNASETACKMTLETVLSLVILWPLLKAKFR